MRKSSDANNPRSRGAFRFDGENAKPIVRRTITIYNHNQDAQMSRRCIRTKKGKPLVSFGEEFTQMVVNQFSLDTTNLITRAKAVRQGGTTFGASYQGIQQILEIYQ